MSTVPDVQSFTSAASTTAHSFLNYTERTVTGMDLNPNNTVSFQNEDQCKMLKEVMTFDQVQLIRVIITWFLFLISAVGNLFVLSCVYRKAKMSHVHMIMMHLAIADLAFTFFVMPNDAVWNTTMEWKVGEALCKICQMFKQIGMYIDSFMVVLIAVDRCCSILQPMSNLVKQRTRTKFLVGGAWLLSILCAIPAPILFGVVRTSLCKDRLYEQCVDFYLMDASQLKVYYFFTMFMTFIFPMFASVVSYWLVIGEITNMIKRDRVMMGRRESCNNIERARKKTLIMTSIVTVSFILLWGPYYAYALYFWFTGNITAHEVTMVLFLLMYVHPAIHPLMYGVFMRDVRAKFGRTVSAIEKVLTCNKTELDYGDHTLDCLSSSKKGQNLTRRTNVDDLSEQKILCPRTSLLPVHNSFSETQKLVEKAKDGMDQVERKEENDRKKRTSTVAFRLPAESILPANNNNDKDADKDECLVFKATSL